MDVAVKSCEVLAACVCSARLAKSRFFVIKLDKVCGAWEFLAIIFDIERCHRCSVIDTRLTLVVRVLGSYSRSYLAISKVVAWYQSRGDYNGFTPL